MSYFKCDEINSLSARLLSEIIASNCINQETNEYIYIHIEHKRKGEQEIEKVMFGMIATNCSSVHETFHLNVMKIERCVYTLIQSDCVAKVVCNL